MDRKNRNSQKAHLWFLPNIHTKFQLSSSIWREDIGGPGHFSRSKREENLISPLLIDLGG